MPIFLIASLRGDDFKVKADSPIHAWSILCEQEKDCAEYDSCAIIQVMQQ